MGEKTARASKKRCTGENLSSARASLFSFPPRIQSNSGESLRFEMVGRAWDASLLANRLPDSEYEALLNR
jgi:hypothetical protein